MGIKYWVGLWMLIGSWQAVAAQAPSSELVWVEQSFDRSKGLQDKHVYQIFEDQRGYFWLITDAHLLFFDGVNFFPVMEHTYSEVFREISIRCQDQQGRIWVRCQDDRGVSFKIFDGYDRRLVEATPFFPEGVDPKEARDVTVDEKGNLYLLTQSGDIWRHVVGGQNWQRNEACISTNFNFAFAENNSRIWLISKPVSTEAYRNLGYWIPGEFRNFNIKDLIYVERMGGDQLVYVTKRFLGTMNEYGSLEPRPLESLFPGFDPEKEEIRSFNSSFGYNQKTGDLFLWHGTLLELANLKTGLSYRNLKPRYLQSVLTGLFDRDNKVWFGTLEGLQQWEYRINAFERIQWKDPAKDEFYHEFSIRGITDCPTGQIFFSANDHLWVYDPLSGSTAQLIFTNNGTSDVIWDAENRRIWTLGNQLISYDPVLKFFETFTLPDILTRGYTFGIHGMGDSILISNSNGMWFFRHADKKFVPFTDYEAFPELKRAEVYGFFELSPSELLLCTNKGIFRWEKGGEVTAHYSSEGEEEFFIPARSVRHIYRDDDGVIWLATAQGLIRWELQRAGTSRFTTIEGLYDNNLYGIFEDRHGFLWLSSNNGILQYHKATGISKHYTVEYGISDNEFNRVSHACDEEGNIYFGSLNGITRFHPDDLVFDPAKLAPKPVDLISLEVFDRNKGSVVDKTGTFFADRRIRMYPSEVNLFMNFAVNDHDIAGGVSYAYRLSNKPNTQWIGLESPSLRIPALPYGKYDIEIRARDGDLEFSDSYLRIPLEVIPPLVLRPWFITVNVLILGVLLLLAVMRAIRRRDVQNRALQRIVEESTQTILADKKLIEAQAEVLLQKNIEKDRFFANISHEFRTPIALILGPAEVLEGSLKSSSREFSLLQTIKNNANGLLKLINDILMLSKIEYGQLSPQMEVFDLNAIVNEVCEEFDALFKRKKVLLNRGYPESASTWINSDRQFVKIIVQNLLSNALKYTAAHREVRLELGLEGENIMMRVEDEGRGIHPDDLPHIFERYYQGLSGNERLEGGTGIGLSLVQELVTALGGRVEVASEWGNGTTFSVVLPFTRAGVKKETTTERSSVTDALQNFRLLLPANLLSLLKGRPILMVDDNPDFYDYLKHILGEVFDVKYASSGKEALVLLGSGLQPVVILTDLMMPEMDGLQLIASIKATPEWRNIPVLALTARAEDQCRIDAFTMGVNDYLLKPFDSRQLIVSIANLIERRAVILDHVEEGETTSTYEEISDWLLEVKELIERSIESTDFSVDELARLMLMSRSSFYNKIKMVTGLTPNQLIMEIRLQKARALLIDDPGLTNKQVMRMIGLKHEPHFITLFTRRFGYTPGQMKN